jgi:hypothetical protein
METVRGATSGTMFAAFTGPSGYTYDKCVAGSPCGGLDTESQGPQANYTRTANDDFIDIATTAGGTGPINIWINGTQITTNETVPTSLNTQKRSVWGNSGDGSTPGPNIARSEALFLVNLTSGQQAALYSNETSFTAGLTTTYTGPGNVIGGETSYSTGLTNHKNLQLELDSNKLSQQSERHDCPTVGAMLSVGAIFPHSAIPALYVNGVQDTVANAVTVNIVYAGTVSTALGGAASGRNVGVTFTVAYIWTPTPMRYCCGRPIGCRWRWRRSHRAARPSQRTRSWPPNS